MKINKYENEYDSYDIEIINNDKVLKIFRQGESITIDINKENYSKISNINFDINEEDGYLYMIFDKLYTNIMYSNVRYSSSSEDLYNLVHDEIVNDNKVIINSDSYPLVCPNTLEISKNDNNIFLNFNKVDGLKYNQFKMPHDIPIHIRMSGSRIREFSILFDVMFRELQLLESNTLVRKR